MHVECALKKLLPLLSLRKKMFTHAEYTLKKLSRTTINVKHAECVLKNILRILSVHYKHF
jgi:hypothetical protein